MGYEQDIRRLRELAASTEESVRLKAVAGLFLSRDIRAIPTLRAMVSGDSSVRVRYEAKKALYLLKKMMFEDDVDSPKHEVNEDTNVFEESDESTHIAINPVLFEKAFRMGSVDDKVRLVQSAVRFDSHEALPVLCRLSEDEQDERVRATLAISIGILGKENEIPYIMAFLKDEDPRVRANAIEGLNYIGHPKVYPIITKYLQDPDNRIRANCVKALKSFGKVNILNMLEKMLASGKLWMRDSAAYCLSVVSRESFLPLLEKGMMDPDRNVRRKVRTAIENLVRRGSERAKNLLKRFSDETMAYHVDDNDELAELVHETGFRLFDDDPTIRRAEVDRIVLDNDQDAVPAMKQRLLEEDDPYVKAAMVSALARVGGKSAEDLLVACLSDDVPRVRANAVEALTMIDAAAVERYCDRLLADDNNRVRANTIVALRDRCPEKCIRALKNMASSDDELCRRSAFWALTDIADSRIVDLLSGFLADKSEQIRTRAVHFVHMLSDQGAPLADEIINTLSPSERRLLMSSADTAAAAQGLGRHADFHVARRYKYDAFKNLVMEKKLDVIDDAKSVLNVSNFYFLREVLQKEKDFVVKVAARRALKNFETLDIAQERLISSEGSEPDFLKSPTTETIVYRGAKQVLKLSQELVVRGKKRDVSGAWFGPFPEQFQILNALREDTRDMIAEIVKGEKLERVSLCYYSEKLEPFLEGERSLDMNRYANIVTLANVGNRLDLYSPSKTFLSSIRNPVYLLVILTGQRVILFLRGPIEDRQARYKTWYYRQITKIEQKRGQGLVSIQLVVGTDELEIPELRPDEADLIADIIYRESVEKIKSEERFIDIDFSEQRRKLEYLRKAKAVSEAEYQYRLQRINKMDAEKFSAENVERILTRRYKDESLASRMDKQLMNRFRDELTIMFTDIVGYSKKTSQKQILDLLTILAIHDSLLLPKIKQYDGDLIKKIGDALMVSFKDPVAAVQCAYAMQEALAAFNESNEDKILIRIGINTGEVFVKDGDVFGGAVNTAAAMEGFCLPGRIFVTRGTYLLIRDRFQCSEQGERKLKDGETALVYLVDSPGESVT